MRGFAISFLTLARVGLSCFCLAFLCSMHPSWHRDRGHAVPFRTEGSTLRPDNKANERIYGRKITAKTILLGNRVSIPRTGRHLVHVLQTNAPHNESKQVASK
jgi:lipid-binding SYLF domain-containing protein